MMQPQAVIPHRLPWLDASKGLGIILVVVGHITQVPLLHGVIYSFHMPFFFFLSGIAFAYSRPKNFLVRHTKSLLIPYFVFCLLCFVYWAIFERFLRPADVSLGSAFFNIFYAGGLGYIFNSVMWFLPCLFTVEVIFYFIHTRLPFRYMRIVAVIICAVCGFILSGTAPFFSLYQLPFRLPVMLDTALVSIFFYATGSAFGEAYKKFFNRISSTVILLSASIAGMCICIFLNTQFDTATDLAELIIPSPELFYLTSFAGIISMASLAMCFPAKIFQKLGRWSLVIMCVHEPIKRIIIKGASVASGLSIDALRGSVTCTVIITVLTLLASVPFAVIIPRFFPWIIGGYKQKAISPFSSGVKK